MSRTTGTDQDVDIQLRRRRIIDEIAALGPTLPGSLVTRTSKCGNSGCRCHTDPALRHGPYWTWTRSVAGKTITRALSDDQVAAYRGWFDNTQRLRELVDELKLLGVDQAHSEKPGLPI